mmetsp:Transcript_5435/g.16462  ORF Transcript_5435/g.16462 Transcript_5435/m.16462 type:complete len:326 (+) Transcript_5435:265-1242(+)
MPPSCDSVRCSLPPSSCANRRVAAVDVRRQPPGVVRPAWQFLGCFLSYCADLFFRLRTLFREASVVELRGHPPAAQAAGNVEGQLERLLGVEAGVAVRVVARLEVCRLDVGAPSDALGDVVARHLQVDAARHGAHLVVHVEERLNLGAHVFVAPRLVALHRLGVAVHGVALPRDDQARILDRLQQLRKVLAQLLRAHAHDDGQPAWDVVRVERLDHGDQVLRVGLVADLDADRVSDSTQEFKVRVVELPRSLAAPQVVRRAVVVLARGAVLASQALLQVHVQALMAGVELGGVERGAVNVNATCAHERKCLIHPLGNIHEVGALL